MYNYTTLFNILRQNPAGKITPSLLKDMGLKLVTDTDDCWWSDKFESSYFNLLVTYNESVLDIVEDIIALDVAELKQENYEREAGEDW